MKNSLLLECAALIQEEIGVYAELLQSELDIMDENTVRIAGTGFFRSILYRSEQHSFSVLEHVKRTGKPVYISSREHPVCKRCATRSICTCRSEICIPLYLSGRFLGTLSCLAYKDAGVERMRNDSEGYRKKLEHLSAVIIRIAEGALNRHLAEGYRSLAQDLVRNSDAPALLLENRRVAEFSPAAADYLENEGGIRIDTGTEAGIYRARNSEDIEIRSSGKRLSMPASYRLVTSDMPFKKRLESIQVRHIGLQDTSLPQDYSEKITLDYFVGTSPDFVAFKEKALQTYKNSRFMFLTGERGIGKESWVRGIHHSSGAPQDQLVVLDCKALYELSNFAGIFDPKSGLFSRSNVTVCLKEISALAPWFQRKLADSERGMQENNIRLVATSTESPDALLKDNVISHRLYMLFYPEFLRIPPLREREIDIEYYILDCIEKYRNFSGKKVRIQKKAMEKLKSFPWPGNFKQMEQVISALIAGSVGNTITAADVEALPAMAESGEDLNLKAREKELIREALRKYSGPKGKTAAAEALGIGKATLYRKIREYALEE